MPICGRTPTFSAYLQDQPELGVLLDDRDDVAPDLLGQHRHLDELGVLEAVADDRRVVVGLRGDGEQLRLGARLEAEAVLAAEIEHFLDDLALLVDLDRVDADVAPCVLVLGDGRLEGVVRCRRRRCRRMSRKRMSTGQPDAAEHQVIGQLLEVDGPGRVLRGMNQHVPLRRDGEVALPPAVHLVEFGGVADGKDLSRLPVTVTARRGCAHATNDTHLFLRSGQTFALAFAVDGAISAAGARGARRQLGTLLDCSVVRCIPGRSRSEQERPFA